MVLSRVLVLIGVAFVVYGERRYLSNAIAYYTEFSPFSAFLLLAFSFAVPVLALYSALRPQLKFIWHCFISRLPAGDQRTRLGNFYSGQADIYDATRGGLLRGRNTMLSLSASHIRTMHARNPKQKLIWVDVGGGTGYNIESMDRHFPVSAFDAIYLIDLCEPLLQVARERFSKRGWTHITVLCQDATEFSLPGWAQSDPKGSVSFVTLSYSLSMIPNFYALLDRIDYILSSEDGLLSVVDFYTSGKQLSLHEKAIGGTSKECSWLSRWFWQIWFDFDHVSASPHRRDYLEYKFGTVKTYNGRNRFVIPFIVHIPYYIWLGRSRSCDVSNFCHAFEVEGGNMIGNCSSTFVPTIKDAEAVSPVDVGYNMKTPPLSSFHYQLGQPWRLPYYDQPVHKDFRTFIYAFTWEDPDVDLKYLDLGPEDSMLVITSGGDNALHYAIAAQPKRIHCVDMNPCQGHLLELKLAAMQTLEYDDFFAMFGDGHHPNFPALLDSKIAPFLSSIAYQYWRINDNFFSRAFYSNGYSGWAIWFIKIVFSIAGVSQDAEALCNAGSIAKQEQIWHEKIKPVLLNPMAIGILTSPIFCWNALGVPLNQRRMILEEGTLYEYVRDSMDPLLSTYSLKDGAYFYPLTLLGHYTSSSCPEYLTRCGFRALKANNGEAMNAFRLHTDSIYNVLRGLTCWSLTRAVIMDHLDWFSPESKDVDDEVDELYRVLSPGGFVLWRSAARKPWYCEVFERKGFSVTALGVRKGSEVALDRVNMYASFWRAVKTT